MLKIKDNVDLKELEKFGFKPRYSEDTGKVIAYEKIDEKEKYIGLTTKKETITVKIRIFKRNTKNWVINKYKEYADLDTLYDLIRADLVEKI